MAPPFKTDVTFKIRFTRILKNSLLLAWKVAVDGKANYKSIMIDGT